MKQEQFSLPEENPFEILDQEIGHLNRFFDSLDEEGWTMQTRCDEWRVREMVAHFDSDEAYNEACLEDKLKERYAIFTDFDDFNKKQVQMRAHLSNEEILSQWRRRQSGVRREWDELGLGAMIPTSIGPYPLHSQIWHITSEYATHGDDMYIGIPEEEKAGRLKWRVQFSLYAVQEKKSPPGLERRDDQIMVSLGGHQVSLSQEDFVAAVSLRLPFPVGEADKKVIKSLRALA